MPAPRTTSRPRETRSATLAKHAALDVNTFIKAKIYIRKADLVLKQADTYRRVGDEDQLYHMLVRFASLVLETIPKAPGYNANDPHLRALRVELRDRYMPEMERLKVSIDLRYDEEARWQSTKLPDTTQVSASNLPELNWASQQTGTATAAPPPDAPPPSDDLAKLAAMSAGFASMQMRPASKEAMSRHAVLAAPTTRASPALTSSGSSTMYPAFDQSASAVDLMPVDLPPIDRALPSAPPLPETVQVVVPPHATGAASVAELLSLSASVPPTVPLGPQELQVVNVPAPMGPHPGGSCSEPPPPPPPVVALSPPTTGVKPLAKRTSLRDVHVSLALMEDFLSFARNNTRRGIETCGILAGTLSANDSIFTISTLIIPKQEGTTDTVQALGEEEIFDVQDTRGLYPLGWIHTHPTQSCFLSSIDVHTHCGYQTMLDEAVAIVMAPQDPSKRCGMFRLTTPGGLKLIQRCTLRGFHTHPPTETGQEIYELCGHVYINPRAKHDVVDLRQF